MARLGVWRQKHWPHQTAIASIATRCRTDSRCNRFGGLVTECPSCRCAGLDARDLGHHDSSQASPTAEPIFEPIFEPVFEPVFAAVLEPVFAAVLEPIFARVLGPIDAPVFKPGFESAVGPAFESVLGPVFAPMLGLVFARVLGLVDAPIFRARLGRWGWEPWERLRHRPVAAPAGVCARRPIENRD
jgi:hypothetical protein